MNGQERRLEAVLRIAAAVGSAAGSGEPATAEEAARRVDEAYCALIGCAEHAAALAAAGLGEVEARRLRVVADALRDAGSLLAAAPEDATRRRLAAARDALYAALGEATGRLRARAAFAFRHDATDARRRLFFSSYSPRLPRGGGRRTLCETVELKLR
jgi:hypothetical protein